MIERRILVGGNCRWKIFWSNSGFWNVFHRWWNVFLMRFLLVPLFPLSIHNIGIWNLLLFERICENFDIFELLYTHILNELKLLSSCTRFYFFFFYLKEKYHYVNDKIVRPSNEMLLKHPTNRSISKFFKISFSRFDVKISMRLLNLRTDPNLYKILHEFVMDFKHFPSHVLGRRSGEDPLELANAAPRWLFEGKGKKEEEEKARVRSHLAFFHPIRKTARPVKRARLQIETFYACNGKGVVIDYVSPRKTRNIYGKFIRWRVKPSRSLDNHLRSFSDSVQFYLADARSTRSTCCSKVERSLCSTLFDNPRA